MNIKSQCDLITTATPCVMTIELPPCVATYRNCTFTRFINLFCPDSWEQFFNHPETIKICDKISTLLWEERNKSIFPLMKHILYAFELCPFDKMKVVILGQDPYPTFGHAMGLAFSVPENVRPLPPSLRNINIELNNDVNVPKAEARSELSSWARQGVFLINTALTVLEGCPKSHSNIWQSFSSWLISWIIQNKKNLVFILWGSDAQKSILGLSQEIYTNGHLMIKSAHPSPFSADRGFFGSKPFSRCNDYLKLKKIEPIKW